MKCLDILYLFKKHHTYDDMQTDLYIIIFYS